MTIEEDYDLDVDADEARDSLNTVGDLIELGKKHGLQGKSGSADS